MIADIMASHAAFYREHPREGYRRDWNLDALDTIRCNDRNLADVLGLLGPLLEHRWLKGGHCGKAIR
ncbi:hypothetical protein HQ563_13060 [bacterium]|nr:hypothetical protein [bacterium]